MKDDKQTEKDANELHLFTCQNRMIIDEKLVNDLVVDCGSEAEDEPQLKALLLKQDKVSCINSYQLPCKEGHSRCYNITDIFKYQLNEFNHLTPCRTGDHLQSCREFECNSMFKCTQSYCLLWFLCK